MTPPCPVCIVNRMRILVCVKQVPDTESLIQIDDKAGWIRTDEIFEFKMNRLDEFAVEEAVLIKEASLDTEIDAVTVGPGRCADVLKRSIGMGADKGIHINLYVKNNKLHYEINETTLVNSGFFAWAQLLHSAKIVNPVEKK